jgi:hypothetical protein
MPLNPMTFHLTRRFSSTNCRYTLTVDTRVLKIFSVLRKYVPFHIPSSSSPKLHFVIILSSLTLLTIVSNRDFACFSVFRIRAICPPASLNLLDLITLVIVGIMKLSYVIYSVFPFTLDLLASDMIFSPAPCCFENATPHSPYIRIYKINLLKQSYDCMCQLF